MKVVIVKEVMTGDISSVAMFVSLYDQVNLEGAISVLKIFQEYFGFGEFFVVLYDQVNLGGAIRKCFAFQVMFHFRKMSGSGFASIFIAQLKRQTYIL